MSYNPLVDPIFEIMGADGSHVRIYADGRVTGYPVECMILNGIATLVHAAESLCGTDRPLRATLAAATDARLS